jgi:signal transduction histidine kinase
VIDRAREDQPADPLPPAGLPAFDELREANERLLLASLREQETAEQARRREAELTALLDNMTEGVTLFDADGEVVMANPVGRQLFDFTKERPTLADYQRAELRSLDGRAADFAEDVLERLLHGERFADQELILMRQGAPPRHLSFNGTAVRNGDGRVVLAIQTFRDVTALRELERMREQYVSLISHDLRGPLLAASLAAEVLIEDPSDPDRTRQFAARIFENLQRTGEMVHDLLDSQRIRAGQPLPLVLAECDLVGIAREVIVDLVTQHRSNVVIEGEDHVVGRFSAKELRRAIWNLLSNAIKYGSPKTPVTIRFEKTDALARVKVHNWGQPILPEHQESLFSPFLRTPASASTGGWGLGLTLVRGAAEAHGGRVEVTSSVEAGTTFTLILPLER